MTRLVNKPEEFVDEAIDGLVAACSRWVRRIPGGIARATPPPPGTVAVIIGGGSGHYPAFGGLVGEGLAHGAAIGNVFASPSAKQIYDVAIECNRGAGVLFTYGNYAGDVLNFNQAQARLEAADIPCRTVVVTDDVASAPAEDRRLRRGVAGDLVVFKAAAAAADRGDALEAVAEVAQRANSYTRSFGVAFSGCTLPGATGPLFSVPDGRMAIGMGVHGEPGFSEADIPTADELADLFVDTLLAEAPGAEPKISGARVALILNGLGSVKYEELYVVYRRIAQRLETAGITVIDPEVGELITSFDMAGASLTLSWLDDELEALWRAPTDAPGHRKTSTDRHGPAVRQTTARAGEVPPSTPESHRDARRICSGLASIAAALDAHAGELGRLDSVAGDGDHGIGMLRGARAALAAATAAQGGGAGARTTLQQAGEAWADRAGGASGALWGLGLRAAAERLSDAAATSEADVVRCVEAAAARIQEAGGAQKGDKTLVDALLPFRDELRSAVERGGGLASAWSDAAAAAERGARQTAEMISRHGRARAHQTRSLGSIDPGAWSLVLVARAALYAPGPGPTGEQHGS